MTKEFRSIGVMLSGQEMSIIEKKAEEQEMTKHSYLNELIFNYIKRHYITGTPKVEYLKGRTQYTLRVPMHRWVILDNIQKYNGVKLKKAELIRYILIEALKENGVNFDKPKRMLPLTHCRECSFLNKYSDCLKTENKNHIDNVNDEIPEWCPLPIYPIAI